MLSHDSLRGRLIAACLLLAAVVGGAFAVSAFVMVERIEDVLIEQRLDRAAQLWSQAGYGPVQPETFDLSFLKGEQLPASLRSLPPGTHELRLNGRGLRVLIGEASGMRYAVVDDQTDFESIEFGSSVAMGCAFAVGLVLAVLVGWASANRVIRPLTNLARAVQSEYLPGLLPGLGATDEIGVLARTVAERTLQLEQALQRERWFTADVSHELRTPLTVMLGAAEVLIGRLRERPDLAPMAERIRRNAADAAQQVDALLQLGRAPMHAEFARIDMAALAAHEVERYQPLVHGKNLSLQLLTSGEAFVQGVPALAAIAVGNLLRNACQHTVRGQITVSVSAEGIVVEDTGAGVPDAVRGRLFERFVHGGEESATPSGLGLSIVKRVAELHGWAVDYEPGARGGSRFTLRFSAS